jgi:hypothetical protein
MVVPLDRCRDARCARVVLLVLVLVLVLVLLVR